MSVAALLAEIVGIGQDSVRGGYSRHLFDEADLSLRDWFRGKAEVLGLRVEQDRNANLWAWWDAGAGTAVLTGSHLDSVPGGGAYDGPLGVACGLDAVRQLKDSGFVPARPIAVAVFAEEEGARFNAPCLGSRLLVGEVEPATIMDRRDAAGRTFAEVVAAAGVDASAMGADPELLARVGLFVEVHIEQGLDLEPRGEALAVATAILAHGRWRASFHGEGNHAGTTPMGARHDPLVAAAEAILAVRRIAEAGGASSRGTVGRISAVPGGSNVVASRVEIWIDLRDEHDAGVDALRVQVEAALAQAAADEGCTYELVCESFSTRVDFDPALRERVAALLGGIPTIPTGAGHDAGILAAYLPTAMLFVRNPSGVSHAPGEGARDEDVEAGGRALADVLRELAG